MELDKAYVPEVFDEVARAYDRQVDLNPGYHANLRRAAQALLTRLPADVARAPRLVDVGCGTGASTRALAATAWRRGVSIDLLGLDGSAEMIAQAQAKRWPRGVRFAQSRVEQAADVVPSGVDGVFACYLLRNVTEPDEVLGGLAALLPPGGVVAVHDYSVKGNLWATAVWTLVCWTVVIPLGWITARHTRLYRYLWRSVLDFDTVPEVVTRLERAGFGAIQVVPATGWQRGILHTVVGRKL